MHLWKNNQLFCTPLALPALVHLPQYVGIMSDNSVNWRTRYLQEKFSSNKIKYKLMHWKEASKDITDENCSSTSSRQSYQNTKACKELFLAIYIQWMYLYSY